MNDKERDLIHWICEGDMRRTKMSARAYLETVNAKKDQEFVSNSLRKLKQQGTFIKLPSNLEGMLVAEESSLFPHAKFLLRKEDEKIVIDILNVYRVAVKLHDRGIPYLPAAILYGDSGCGKTMLARYIAYKARLPFVYIRFSNLIDSYLGKTQENVGRIFDYARANPCVLCFDEIDAVGGRRGAANDLRELNRVTISLMQELDRMHNKTIIIATTNRIDAMDEALVRRLPYQHHMQPFQKEDIEALAEKFFAYAGYDAGEWVRGWCQEQFDGCVPASAVIKACTDWIVQQLLADIPQEEPEESFDVVPDSDISNGFLFDGLLICSRCGQTLEVYVSNKDVNGMNFNQKRYRCPNYIESRCNEKKSIDEQKLLHLVLWNIREAVYRTSNIQVLSGIQQIRSLYDSETFDEEKMANAIRQAISSIEVDLYRQAIKIHWFD